GLYSLTRAIPQLGESFLKMYPERFVSSNVSSFRSVNEVNEGVRFRLVVIVTSWGLLGSPTRRIASRGVPNPASTSGQTGTHSTYRLNTSVRNRSRLCPPSKRTSSPNKHRLTPIRIGSTLGSSLGTIIAVRLGIECLLPAVCILPRPVVCAQS